MFGRSPSPIRHRSRPLAVAALFAASLYASDIDSAALQKDQATVLSATGQVSTERKGQDWAITASERVLVTMPVFTGPDGYARLRVAGGTTFEVFGHTRVLFRQNPGNPQDLLDIKTGRVRIVTTASAEEPLQTRVLTPAAVITCHGAASFAIAVDDEDNTTRIDVQQGQVEVRHALLPRLGPELVKAGDAISVDAGAPIISRRLDRGSLYHCVVQAIWRALGSALPGHSGDGSDENPPVSHMLALRFDPLRNR